MSGYGRYIEIKHVNGFETGYGHQSAIADGIKPGVKVRQGQIIGYVGSTGNSTGNHLHFEIKVNGRFVDPLSVKLPRDHTLPSQESGAFKQTIAQINDLMRATPPRSASRRRQCRGPTAESHPARALFPSRYCAYFVGVRAYDPSQCQIDLSSTVTWTIAENPSSAPLPA